MKRWIVTCIVLFLSFVSLPVEAKGSEVYIAIGDSLAAGQTPYRQIDTGYTDLIAQELQRLGKLGFYSKALAFPGYTTGEVLHTVQTKEAKGLLKSATVVTISAGANDLLQLVQVNPANGSIAYQQIPTDLALNNVRKNITSIIQEVKLAAPKAKIYVMGYYFAYPHIQDTQKQGISKELTTLHTILKTEALANGAMYVSVEESFVENAKELIPNQADVHPTMEGYRLMANAFLKQYHSWVQVYPLELPAPNPLSFEEIIKRQSDNSTQPVSRIEGFDQYLSLTEFKAFI